MRVKYLIPVLVLILIFGFTSLTSCKAEEIIEEEEVIEEPIDEEIVELVEKEIIEEPIKEEIIEPIEEEIEIIEEEKEQEQIQEQPQEQEEEIIAEEPVEEEPQQAQYCGSINSDVYHYPSCHYVDRIKPENLIWFIDANDAKSKGYRPCKKCNPPG
ncbi:hypothetical protein ES705_11201 [subsurface metagenome]